MKKNNIKEVEEISYASPTKRVLGFFIDYMLITFIRTLVLQICIFTFLAKHLASFFEAMVTIFGASFSISRLDETHLQLFIGNRVFIEVLLVILLIILIAPIYNVIFIKSKIKTTLGKRIFKVYPKTNDGNNLGITKIICHYLASLIPVVLAIGFISIEMLKYHNIIEVQYSNFVTVIILLVIVSWYDLVFITKKHIMVHDLICGVCFITKGKPEKQRSIFALNKKLEEYIGKIKVNLKEVKRETLNRKTKFKETIKEVKQKAEVRKKTLKKKTKTKSAGKKKNKKPRKKKAKNK